MSTSDLFTSKTSPINFWILLPLAALLLIFNSRSTLAQPEVLVDELPRLSQVSDGLYRGAQPQPGGLRRLAEMNINTVVNLRGTSKRTKADEAEASALSLRYFNVPLPTWGRPKDSDVLRILEIITNPENGRVFVHCKDGVDRTGVIVALYRIKVESWTAESALAEAKRSGMRGRQIWMRDYIEDYYERRIAEEQSALAERDAARTDFGDRLGMFARGGEYFTFKATKTAKRIGRFLDRMF